MKSADDFLIEHKLRAADIDMENIVGAFTRDMADGLAGREGALRMIPTYIEADNEFLTEVPVLAIDAGGTNFRAAMVRFDSTGKIEVGEIVNRKMPGLESEISSEEFFSDIAGYIRPLADETDRIGFCFSYPTEILPDRDGILIQFCKEVRAPGVVGKLIGKNLLDTLGTPGKKIVILNDTVATLLAGKSAAFRKSYDSFIGFILGTGTNTCYIEQNINILKNSNLDKRRSQIINIESGNFLKGPRTDLDLVFDSTTKDPGSYTFEKMFSGGYFGGLCLAVLRSAAGEMVLSEKSKRRLDALKDLTSNDANSYVSGSGSDGTALSACFEDSHDTEAALKIIEALIERAAVLVASNLAAVVLKTEKGKSAERPVLITAEGTTFYKLHNFRERFEGYFYNYLSGERKRYIEFTEVEQSSLIGAALAALIE